VTEYQRRKKYLTKKNNPQIKTSHDNRILKTNENPITCYQSKPCVNIENSARDSRSTIKKATWLYLLPEKKGRIPSVLKLLAVKMNYSTLCSSLNGRAKNPTEYKIYNHN
jgi:hypothetical protein